MLKDRRAKSMPSIGSAHAQSPTVDRSIPMFIGVAQCEWLWSRWSRRVLGGQDDEKIEQDSFENANAGEEGDSGTADEGPGDSPLNFDFDCVQIDRVEAPKIVPQRGFR